MNKKKSVLYYFIILFFYFLLSPASAEIAIDVSGGKWDLGSYGANFTTSTSGGYWAIQNNSNKYAVLEIRVDTDSGWSASEQGSGGENAFALRLDNKDGQIIHSSDQRLDFLEGGHTDALDLWFQAPNEHSSIGGAHSHTVVITAREAELPYIWYLPMGAFPGDEYKLYIHPTDNSRGIHQWASGINNQTGATSFTDGAENTEIIVNDEGDDHPAAEYCYNLDAYNYNDWYLPAADQLYVIYVAQEQDDPQNFYEGDQDSWPVLHKGDFEDEWVDFRAGYWSSTEYDQESAYRISFSNGLPHDTLKFDDENMRAVRDDR